MKNYNLGEVINFLVENDLWGKQCFSISSLTREELDDAVNKYSKKMDKEDEE